MNIVFFHNWSLLGSAVACGLLEARLDQFLFVGPPVAAFLRDDAFLDRIREAGGRHIFAPELEAERFLARLREFEPDLLLVVTFPHKLPQALLELPRLAALNLHPSLLPRYRGACPEFWVIREGEAETGVTLHHMTSRFDQGNIVGQQRVPILEDDTLLSLTERMCPPALELIQESLDDYRNGLTPVARPQANEQASRAPMVREKHLSIDWTEPARSIDRLLRAAYPAYEPLCRFRGQPMIVHRARVQDVEALAQPGELRALPALKRLFVATGQGWLELLEVGFSDSLAHRPGWALWETFAPHPGERLEPY